MDNLKALLRNLTPKMAGDFQDYLQKYKNKHGRKDLELLDLMQNESLPNAKAYTERLYGKHNLNGYQGLRKRLFKKLSVFLSQQYMDNDQSAVSMLSGYISIIRYLLDQNELRLAWVFLNKAEKLAIDNEQYDLLNTIYGIQIEHAGNGSEKSLQAIIKNKQYYRRLADQQEEFSLVCALVNERLKAVKFRELNTSIEQWIGQLMQEYHIDKDTVLNPRSVFHLLSITRSAAIANRDFDAFLPYLLKQYQKLEAAQVFTKSNHLYKLQILFMVAHTLYRTRNFEASLTYQQTLENEMSKFNNLYQKRFYVRLVMMQSGTMAFKGEAVKAIELTENLLQEYRFIEETDRLGALLNLGLYYFLTNDLNKANQVNLRIGHTDNYCIKKMGKEWTMKKNLMEIIIQYELENDEIALQRIKLFRKQYHDLFQQKLYSRVKDYVNILQKTITSPFSMQGHHEIEKSLVLVPVEKEDLQAMAFYSWLKAKFNKTSYYEALLDTVN